jgi:hypothetical protein
MIPVVTAIRIHATTLAVTTAEMHTRPAINIIGNFLSFEILTAAAKSRMARIRVTLPGVPGRSKVPFRAHHSSWKLYKRVGENRSPATLLVTIWPGPRTAGAATGRAQAAQADTRRGRHDHGRDGHTARPTRRGYPGCPGRLRAGLRLGCRARGRIWLLPRIRSGMPGTISPTSVWPPIRPCSTCAARPAAGTSTTTRRVSAPRGVRRLATAVVPEAGHFIPDEQPAPLWRHIGAFITNGPGPGRDASQ